MNTWTKPEIENCHRMRTPATCIYRRVDVQGWTKGFFPGCVIMRRKIALSCLAGSANASSHIHLALSGIKNWPPSMKVKKFENFGNKRGSTCCKWPNLNTPGTHTPLHHPNQELTKPNLTAEQSSLPLHFDSFHPLLSATAHTTAIFPSRFSSIWSFEFRFCLHCLWENSSKFSHAPHSRSWPRDRRNFIGRDG